MRILSSASGVLSGSALGVLAFAAALLGVKVLAPTTPAEVAVLLGVLAFGVFLAVLPTHHLPAAALTLYVLVPQQAVGYLYGASPAVLALLAWTVRRCFLDGSRQKPDRLVVMARAAALAALSWAIFLVIATGTPDSAMTSRNWTVSFALGAVLPLLVTANRRDIDTLWRVFPVLTVIVATYAVVEFAVQQNVFFDSVYEIAGRPVEQTWAVYRSHASFGHPLYAATFFATSAAAGLARWFSDRQSWLWIAASMAGLTVSVSRGGLIAVAAGAMILLIAGWPRFRRGDLPGYRSGLVLMSVTAVLVLASGILQGRSGSREAATSSEARTEVQSIAVAVARETGWIGIGPGASDQAIQLRNDHGIGVENSLLQVFVSLGVPGSMALGILVLALLARSFQTGNLSGLAALTALLVAMTGYNAIEGVLPLHALLGLVFMIAITAPTSDQPRPRECGPP